MCRQGLENDKTDVKHIDTEEEDCSQSEYTTLTNDQAKASVKSLKTTTKVHHMKHNDNENIRPLWVAQSKDSKIHQTDCEVDTGAGCNILPVHKAKELFGQE